MKVHTLKDNVVKAGKCHHDFKLTWLSFEKVCYASVIVEAKSYHRPCVIFPSGGMPELITHKIDGYICGSKTENALFEGMKFYCDNKMLLSSHKQASYESILKLGIDRKTYEQKWFEVFERY